MCQPTAIRASQQPHINSNLTNLAFSDTWMTFGIDMASTAAYTNSDFSDIPQITEAFMNDPSTAAEVAISLSDNLVFNLTATDQQLQTRAQQLINTYWQASVNPALVTVGLRDAPDAATNIQTRRVEATNDISIDIYIVNWAWWVAFMCATSIMFALACLALIVDCFLRGPEVLGYCTTFLRDSPFAINGRVLDVGYIAVVEVDKAQGRSHGSWGKAISSGRKLEKGGRLYAWCRINTSSRTFFFLAPRPLGRSHSFMTMASSPLSTSKR